MFGLSLPAGVRMRVLVPIVFDQEPTQDQPGARLVCPGEDALNYLVVAYDGYGGHCSSPSLVMSASISARSNKTGPLLSKRVIFKGVLSP